MGYFKSLLTEMFILVIIKTMVVLILLFLVVPFTDKVPSIAATVKVRCLASRNCEIRSM